MPVTALWEHTALKPEIPAEWYSERETERKICNNAKSEETSF